MLSAQRITFDAEWDHGVLDFTRHGFLGAAATPIADFRPRQFGATQLSKYSRTSSVAKMALSCGRQLQTRASIACAKIGHMLRDDRIGRRNL